MPRFQMTPQMMQAMQMARQGRGDGQALPLSPELAGAPYGGVQVPDVPLPYGGVQMPGGQGLPPGIDPRAVAADPQGFARQQGMLQQAGGDPRQAAMQQALGMQQQQSALGPLAALLGLAGGGGRQRRRRPQLRGRRGQRRRRRQPAGQNLGPLELLSVLGGT